MFYIYEFLIYKNIHSIFKLKITVGSVCLEDTTISWKE